MKAGLERKMDISGYDTSYVLPCAVSSKPSTTLLFIELLLVGHKETKAGYMCDKHRLNFTDSLYKSLASSIDL